MVHQLTIKERTKRRRVCKWTAEVENMTEESGK